MTKTLMHPQACVGARLAEAVRKLSGANVFWLAHDYLFEHQKELAAGHLTVDQIAGAVGVDVDVLRDMLVVPDIDERISADAREARRVGVRGTPTLFVEGKFVDPIARAQLGFWDKMADQFWLERKRPRPASTLLNIKGATQGSPDQPAAP